MTAPRPCPTRRRALVGLFGVTTGLVGLAGGLAACSPPPPRSTVSLRLRGSPADARVTVDDQPVATLALAQKRGIALPPGRHRITVEREGYFPWDRAVDAADAPIVLDVELTRVPE